MKEGRIKIRRFSEGLTVLKPDYYLNKGKKIISDLIDIGVPSVKLVDISSKLYQGGIFKRAFVDSESHGLKYLTFSDVSRINPLETASLISKKYTPWIEEMTLNSGQLLVSCAGTGSCGKAVLVNGSFAGHIGSQEIIRVESFELPVEYLYAYISTPIIYDYIQSMTYGAAIPRISPEELGKLPIILPEESVQSRVKELIASSILQRENAIASLQIALDRFEEKLGKPQSRLGHQMKAISARCLSNGFKRFDSQFHIIDHSLRQEKKANLLYKNIASIASSISVGSRSKRTYVERGLPFLSSSDMMLYNPQKYCRHVSSRTPGLESMIVRSGDILISRSGTVGNVTLVGKDLEGAAVSEHALRLVINSKDLSANYVFAYLKTDSGRMAMESGAFGSVIITLNEDLIGSIEIPILEDEDKDFITLAISEYIEGLDKSICYENSAIAIIENQFKEWLS
jgi:type I restriction enzyme, S subunit